MCTYTTKNFIEIPPCAKKVIFSTEFVLLDLNPPFYEVNQEVWKKPCAWRNFKNIFCVISGYPKKTFKAEKPSVFHFRYVKEVWASGLLGVKASKSQFLFFIKMIDICYLYFKGPCLHQWPPTVATEDRERSGIRSIKQQSVFQQIKVNTFKVYHYGKGLKGVKTI